jgi:hypothetical protein
MAASQPTQALLEIEREATIHIYSLDLNCLAAQALAALGPAGDRARWALEGAVKGLLGPWPELIAAQFEDGPPLAGPTALAWIAGLMGAAAGPSRDQGKTAKKGEKAEKAEKAEKGEKNPKDRPKTAKSFLSSWPGPPPGEEEDDQPEDDRPQAGPATLTWIAGILSSPTGPTGQNDAIANPTWPPAPATPRPGTDQALLELAWESPDQGEVALKAPMDGPATEKSAVAKFLEKDWDDRHDPNRPTASVKDLEALRALGKKLRQSTGARSKLKAYVEVLNQFGHFPALTEAIGRKTLDLVDKYKVREYDPSLAVKALVAVRKASLAHLGDGPDRAPFFKALAEGAQRKLIPLSPYLALTELSDFR